MFERWLPTWEYDLWRAVPDDVHAQVLLHRKRAAAVARIYARNPAPAYWDPGTNRSATVRPPGPDYLLVKAAEYDYLKPLADASVWICDWKVKVLVDVALNLSLEAVKLPPEPAMSR